MENSEVVMVVVGGVGSVGVDDSCSCIGSSSSSKVVVS